MHPHKSLLRQISKIYPPQLSQSQGRIILYNPLEQWVEAHSSAALQDLIEIEACAQPLFLSNCREELILQTDHEVFLEENCHEWMKTVKKKLGSQKAIESETVKLPSGYLNINESGNLNYWRTSGNEKGEEDFYNPESCKSIDKEEVQQPEQLETSINPERLVRDYRHGYNFTPLLLAHEHVYSLHSFRSDQGNSFRKILKSDVAGREGDSAFSACSLPQRAKKLLALGKNLCAYGGPDALMIDNRSQSIVCNFNSADQTEINCMAHSNSKENTLFVARNNEILLLDIRNSSQMASIGLRFEQQIDSFQIFTEAQKSYCCVSFKVGNKIALAEF